ncbi:MAG: ABC transporter permease [Thermodesulfobacteriota bacterium]
MLTSDLLQISLRQLYRNQRRYKGVIIGIALGIAGFVTVLTVGDSVESDLGRNLEILGSATIVKASFDYDRKKRWHHGQYFLKDVEDLKQLPGAASVSPVVWHGGQPISYGAKKTRGRVMGVQDNFFQTFYIPMSRGRPLVDQDDELMRSVCIVGPNVIETLLPENEDPLGRKLLIAGHPFEIVGVLGGVEDKTLLETVLIPLSVARSRIREMNEIRDIYVRGANWDIVPDLQQNVMKVLAANQPGYAEGMMVRYFPERIRTIKRAVLMVKLFLYAALSVTLVLAGLGITNVMLAAVRERTTEIGLRKAVGATEELILSQFLVESVTISSMGGLLGIIVGIVSVAIMQKMMGIQPAYFVLAVSLVAGVVFAAALGVASGYVPARTASRLDAADAMRFE